MDFVGLTTSIITNGIGAVFGAAVLYFSWYRETRTYPALMATFTLALDKMQGEFASRNASVLEAFTALTREERTNYQRWHEENRDRLDRLLMEMRDQRHLVRDLAHMLGLRQAIEAKQEQEQQARAANTHETKALDTHRAKP